MEYVYIRGRAATGRGSTTYPPYYSIMTQSLQLTLSSSTPWDSSYTDQNGNVLYIVSLPFRFVRPKAIIKKIGPDRASSRAMFLI